MFPWLMPDRRARRLSEAFASRLGRTAAFGPGEIVGLEHEYVVRQGGQQVDFASLIGQLVDSQFGLQPVYLRGRWLASGALLYADEREAEIALPPTPSVPGFSHRVAGSAAASAAWLRNALPADTSLHGYSTHVSIAMPALVVDEVAAAYARTFAPALMLLLDERFSFGVLVRPRPGRLELCGEHAEADDLRAAVVFALGSALACLAAIQVGYPCLPRMRLRLRYADTRYGWYVARRAPGDDLYVKGRATSLMTASGEARSAQQHLEEAWSLARAAVAPHADDEELRLVDELVDGRRPLRIERSETQEPVAVAAGSASIATSPYGKALGPRRRPHFDLAPIMLTWDLALFVVADDRRRRRAYAAVPGRLLGRFLDELDAGRLDDLLDRYLRLPSAGRLLSGWQESATPGVYDDYAVRPSLLAPERPLFRPGEEAA